MAAGVTKLVALSAINADDMDLALEELEHAASGEGIDEDGKDGDHGHHEPVLPENPIPNPPLEFKPVDLVPNVIVMNAAIPAL